MPAALKSGRVKLEGCSFIISPIHPSLLRRGSLVHDFFTTQPIKNASVFLLKQIAHDWSDPYAKKILTHLREAATPEPKLLLIDSIIPYACPNPKSTGNVSIPGASPREAPAPLLPNIGAVNETGYNADLTVRRLVLEY
jgi:hypothetical protein